MRVLVCGSRDFTKRPLLITAFNGLPPHGPGPIIVHGNCRGADLMAKAEALTRGWWHWACSANWEREGRAAGPNRNARMLVEARPELVLAFPLPGSRGTHNMISLAEQAGVPVQVY